MRSLRSVLTLILLVGLLAAGCDQGAGEETTVPTTLPASSTTAASTTATSGGSTTVPPTTTAASTTTTYVPPIERLWASPGTSVAAVSAEEAWAFGGEYYWSGIGHFLDGAWTWAWFTFDTDLWAFYGGPGSNHTVSGVAVAPDGTWWVAGPGGVFSGVFSSDGVEWTRRFDYAVSGVAVAPDGTVWIGGVDWRSGVDWLARWDGGSWVSVGSDSPEPPHIPEDSPCGPGPGVATSDGEVWMVGCVNGYEYMFRLLHYDGATLWEVVVDGTTLRDAGPWSPWYTWLDVEAAPNGGVWTLIRWRDTDDRQRWLLGRFDGEVWTTYTPPPFGETYRGGGPAMAVGPDGRVWFALEDGLLAFDGSDWTYHLQGQTVTDVDVAPDGTVWYIDEEGRIDEEGPHILGS